MDTKQSGPAQKLFTTNYYTSLTYEHLALDKTVNLLFFSLFTFYGTIRPNLSALSCGTYSVYESLPWVCHTHFCN